MLHSLTSTGIIILFKHSILVCMKFWFGLIFSCFFLSFCIFYCDFIFPLGKEKIMLSVYVIIGYF